MLTLPLEPTDDRANPIFKDAESCARWLSQLQLTNLQQAHNQLLAQITEFNSYPLQGLERLNTLEQLRETVADLQLDLGKKLITKALPFNEHDLQVFLSITGLWQALVVGYQRCLQAYMAGDKTLGELGALLCQRCLHYTGKGIFEHLCSNYAVDGRLWHQLHELYAYAEQQDLHLTDVPDTLVKDQIHSNCTISYVKILLICQAHPVELSRSRLHHLEQWLSVWSSHITVRHSYKPSRADAQPLAADLSSTQGLQPVADLPSSENLRYLAMAPLSKLLRVKIILLQQGQTPIETGLGDFYNAQQSVEFLTFLHQCWCESKRKRICERKPAASHALICYSIEGIFAHLSGKPYNPDAMIQSVDGLAYRQIETLGHALHHTSDNELLEMSYPLENWQFEEESIAGACLTRCDNVGSRLSHRQLIALRPGNAKKFILGSTTRVSVTQQGKLQIGVKYLPGQVEALLIKAPGINTSARQVHTPALLLQAMPVIGTPASMVIPRNWFQAGRVIEGEYQDGKKFKVRLGFSVESGLDYERVSFTPVQN